MSIRVECKACGSSHSLNRRLLGRTIRCPICDAAMEVPADSPTVQDSDDEQEIILNGEVADGELVEAEGVELVKALDIEPELVETEFADADLIGDKLVDSSESEIEPVLVEAVAGSGGLDGDSGAVESMVQTSRAGDDEEEEIAFAKRELPKDDMDMTPMVDVTFLLLIFFMITASFTSEKVLEEPPPLSDKSSTNAKEEPEKIQDTVRVQVDEFNAYTIILPGGEDRQASSKQDLMIALEDAKKELVTGVNDNALKMAVEAHTESIHAAVVAAVDAAREKGFSSIQVTVVEEFD